MTTERTPGSSIDLLRRLAPGRLSDHPSERELTVDQTNRSVVVDEQVIVKWLDVPAPAESVGIDVQRHLRAVGFHATPEFIGAEEIGGAVVAIATAHLSGAADGWEWYCSEVESAARSGSLVGLLERARELGQLTADLHVALALPSEVFPATRTEIDIESLGDAGRSLLAEALQITTGEEGSRLAALADRIDAVVSAFDTMGPVDGQRIHGDLHLGQFVLASGELFVIDFDGNPVTDPSRRHHHQPAEKDVASLLQAIDHVGRVVDRRMAGSQSTQIEQWIRTAIDAALAAYLERIGQTDQGDPRLAERFKSNLLFPLRVMQELHEYVYAGRHLPAWIYVPDAAMPAALRQAEVS